MLTKIWNAYENLAVQPRMQSKIGKIIGVVIYLGMTAMAIGLILIWLSDSNKTTYITYKKDTESVQKGPLHRMPDVVMCPPMPKDPKYEFIVNYYWDFMENTLGMALEEVNELTKKFYDLCEPNEDCRMMNEACAGTKFDRYCRKIKNIFDQNGKPNKTMRTWRYTKLDEELERNGGRWTLQMLFMAIVSQDMAQILSGGHNTTLLLKAQSPTDCYLYKIETTPGSERLVLDESKSKICDTIANRLVWAGNSLCTLKFGVIVGETRSPYIGIHPTARETPTIAKGYKARYWLGSLESSTLTLKGMVSLFPESRHSKFRDMARISGVVNYSPIKFIDETGASPVECVEQPVLRGVKIPCTRKDTRTTWNYRFSYARKLPNLWMYPKAMETFTKRAALSPYSTFQLAAGFLGGIVGLSVMKIIGLLRRGILLVNKKAEKPLEVAQLASVILLVTATIGMTVYDLLLFAENRYADVFLSKNSDLPLPRVTFCADRHREVSPAFINISKMYEHKLSPALFTYLERAVWHRDTDIKVPLWVKYTKGRKKPLGVTPAFPWMIKNWDPKPPVFVPISFMENFRHTNGKRADLNRKRTDFNLRHPLYFSRSLITNKYSPRGYNKTYAHAYFQKLNEEAKQLFQKIGLGQYPNMDEVYKYFSVDPGAILRSCSVWGEKIENCGQYAHVETTAMTSLQCLIIEIPEKKFPPEKRKLGPNNGLILEFDPSKYFRESNWQFYYGPGLEKEISADYPYVICHPKKQDPRKIGKSRSRKCWLYKARKCMRPNSWRLKLEHPLWSNSELVTRIPKGALVEPYSYIFEIKESFKKLLSKRGAPCIPREEAVCSHPKFSAFRLAKALRSEELCRCSACFPGDAKSLDVLAIGSRILGRKTHCCTVKEHYDCLLRLQDQLTWNKTGRFFEGESLSNGMLANFLPKIDVFDDADQWKDATIDDMIGTKRFFLRKESLSPEIFGRLKTFLIQCFTPACEQQFIELVNQQRAAPKMDTVTFQIFYGSKTAAGREEEDTLSVAQVTMTAVCGMSVTFGLSAIGIFEVLLLLVKPDLTPGPKRSFKERIYSYWLRSFGIRLGNGSDSAVKPNNDSEPAGENSDDSGRRKSTKKARKPMRNGDEILVDSPISQSESDTDRNEKVVGGTHQNPGNGPSTSAEEIIELEAQSNSVEESTATPQEEGHSNGSAPPEDVGSRNENVTSATKESKKKDIRARFLVSALTAFVLAMVGMLLAVFLRANPYIFTATIANQAVYQPPSVLLCVHSQMEYRRLQTAATEAKCTTRKAQYPVSCSAFFSTFLSTSDSGVAQYCLLFDRSRNFLTLDNNWPDLNLQSFPANLTVYVSALGLNGTDLQELRAYNRWENTIMKVEYTVRKTERANASPESAADARCDQCTANYYRRPPPYICCLGPHLVKPRFFGSQPREGFDFNVGIAIKKNKLQHKSLVVQAADDNVIKFRTEKKFDGLTVFSVFSGFMSFFTGLSWFNFASLIVACMATVVQKILSKMSHRDAPISEMAREPEREG